MYEIVERIKDVPVESGPECGSGRGFWLELKRRVEAKLTTVGQLTAIVKAENLSDGNVIRKILKDLGELQLPPGYASAKKDLSHGLAIDYHRSSFNGAMVIFLKVENRVMALSSLAGHRFELFN